MTSVSPVWLQLRRRGPETFDVTGLHDHDPGGAPPPPAGWEGVFWCWLCMLFCLLPRLGQSCTQIQQKTPDGWVSVWEGGCRSSSAAVFQDVLLLPPVPRLLFDGWSYQDYMSVLASEDEIEELASELVDVAKVVKFAWITPGCDQESDVWWRLRRCRPKVSMASPWSFGANWGATRRSRFAC